MSSWTNERGGAAGATLVGRSREGGAGARARLPLRGVALPLERDDKLLDLLLDLRLRARFHLRLFPLQVVFAFQRSQLPSEFEDRWGVHSVAERRTARDCPRTNVAPPQHPPALPSRLSFQRATARPRAPASAANLEAFEAQSFLPPPVRRTHGCVQPRRALCARPELSEGCSELGCHKTHLLEELLASVFVLGLPRDILAGAEDLLVAPLQPL